jgi:hypothetical protein
MEIARNPHVIEAYLGRGAASRTGAPADADEGDEDEGDEHA